MSNTKLGLLVFWPTFWTGFPIKLAIGLLLLSAHLHPWEGTGLAFLLLLSIPIDIWALGLCARTLFLERLKIEPQPGLGLALWWKWTLFNLIYLPLLYFVVGWVASGAKAVTASIIEMMKEHVWAIPVAEQISLELVMWGSVASVVLILLIMGWLFGLGAIVQRHVRNSVQQDGSYQDMVFRWDSLRVPSDQPLLLTGFTGVGVVLVFLFWGFLPSTTPHPHDEYEYTNVVKVEAPVIPKEVLKKTENVLARAKLTVEKLEKEKGKERRLRLKEKRRESRNQRKRKRVRHQKNRNLKEHESFPELMLNEILLCEKVLSQCYSTWAVRRRL